MTTPWLVTKTSWYLPPSKFVSSLIPLPSLSSFISSSFHSSSPYFLLPYFPASIHSLVRPPIHVHITRTVTSSWYLLPQFLQPLILNSIPLFILPSHFPFILLPEPQSLSLVGESADFWDVIVWLDKDEKTKRFHVCSFPAVKDALHAFGA